jgi:hypothetical protein
MRMSLSKLLPSKQTSACLLLFRFSGGVYENVAYQMMVGAFDTDPSVQMLQHYPTFLNVDNMPKDTYGLDEINQHFQH